MTPRPYSSRVLALCGLILVGMGLYFVLMRPALLPEDVHYIGTDMAKIRASVPGLLDWLEKVFWVMGGYILTVGILTLYVALTSFRSRTKGVSGTVTLAGLASIGWMAAVNFIIDSDYKWLLLAFTVLWAVALALFWLEGGGERRIRDV
ncbi:MAG: hypothetical protein K0S10_524 [Rubrobacteraceae bacterium]|jgi:hypothetical protein|nr:hypothetical protein [Rubrobacteraceae bacterium]